MIPIQSRDPENAQVKSKTVQIMYKKTAYCFTGCPENNVNLQDRVNNEVISGVKSWVDCSRKCSAKSSCIAWAWAHEGAGAYALNCGLMDGFGKKAIDTNVISGGRDCPGN